MDQQLQSFIAISRLVGEDTRLVQGGGGNTSVKTADGQYMYVKASGTALRDVSETRGWRRLRVKDVSGTIGDESLMHLETNARDARVTTLLDLSCDDDCDPNSRPSVETNVHAMLDICAIHVHPLAVGAFVSARNGKAVLQDLFKDEEFPPIYVPCADPGYPLAVKVAGLLKRYEKIYGCKPSIMFLDKHGLFVHAATPDAAADLMKRVVQRCAGMLPMEENVAVPRPDGKEVQRAKLSIGKAFADATKDHMNVEHFLDEDIARFLAREDAKALASLPCLTPDELVYANGSPMWLDTVDAQAIGKRINRQLARGQKPSLAFLSKSLGLFIAGTGSSVRMAKEVIEYSLAVRAFASGFGGVKTLTPRQRDFIINWEPDHFRKRVAGTDSGGELRSAV